MLENCFTIERNVILIIWKNVRTMNKCYQVNIYDYFLKPMNYQQDIDNLDTKIFRSNE